MTGQQLSFKKSNWVNFLVNCDFYSSLSLSTIDTNSLEEKSGVGMGAINQIWAVEIETPKTFF